MIKNSKVPVLYIILICLPLLVFGNQASAQIGIDSTAIDSILLNQVQLQLEENALAIAPTQILSGLSFNPDVGVIGDFQMVGNTRGKKNINAYQ